MLTDTTIEVGVSEFVALLNQTMEFAYPSVVVHGELANFRVSKNRWVYFDLKDELAVVKFFGTVYQLPGPLEEGMMLKVRGQPRLHQAYGFSINVQSIQPAGEGTIRRAAELLAAKLSSEGLFDEERKRPLPYPPNQIGLITSRQSAAYADFVKILNARWRGVTIHLADVQVQGEIAPAQITQAVEYFNTSADPPEVIVMIRGGGSPEDLAAFNTEHVTRAIAASRVPTLVAIGHEIDISLAELAADRRASTPSNAAELLTPDRVQSENQLKSQAAQLQQLGFASIRTARTALQEHHMFLDDRVGRINNYAKAQLESRAELLAALSPNAILRRGYAVVRSEERLVRSALKLSGDAIVEVQLYDGRFTAVVKAENRSK
jgi:exodeoxyribonuclease VII large subunit